MPYTKQGAEIWRDYVTDGVPASGAQPIGKGDMRTWMAETEQFSGIEALATIASAATVDLGSVRAWSIAITGTTNISSFGTSAPTGAMKVIRFAGILTLTHSANLICPDAANITTAADTVIIARYEGSSVWRVVFQSDRYHTKGQANTLFAPPRHIITNLTIYRSTQTFLQGGVSATYAFPGTGVTASLLQWKGATATLGSLVNATWRLVWDPNVSSGSSAVRLVHADSGPSNITQITSFSNTGTGSVLNDAVDVTSTLQSFLTGATTKQIGHQTAGNATTGPRIYMSEIECVWSV